VILPQASNLKYLNTSNETEDHTMTKETANDRIRLTVTAARELGEAAMRGAGCDDDEARILTDHVLDAALCGYEYSGLPKLLNVVDAAHFRRPRQRVSVVRETGPTAMLDGGNNNGMIAAYRASEATIERANANGLAIVCLANTWMTGRSAYYCEMIARAGLVVIHTVAAPPAVAPFGGTRPALGTNPIAFGFPTNSDPLVIDMGTSAFMGTDLQFRARLGAALPEGVALGPDGQPTTGRESRPTRRAATLRWRGERLQRLRPRFGHGCAWLLDRRYAAGGRDERLHVHRVQTRPVSPARGLSPRSHEPDRNDQGDAAAGGRG
jgi:LDH2 family malate/lactate/ureidoglycolate dehydrogenase